MIDDGTLASVREVELEDLGFIKHMCQTKRMREWVGYQHPINRRLMSVRSAIHDFGDQWLSTACRFAANIGVQRALKDGIIQQEFLRVGAEEHAGIQELLASKTA